MWQIPLVVGRLRRVVEDLCPRQEPEQIYDARYDYGSGSNWHKFENDWTGIRRGLADENTLIWPMSVRHGMAEGLAIWVTVGADPIRCRKFLTRAVEAPASAPRYRVTGSLTAERTR
jgi:hypothetical protein